MLAQTLVIVALIAILASSAVSGIAGVARARTAAAADALIAPGTQTAIARYEQTIAATIGAQVATAARGTQAPPATIAALNGTIVWPQAQYLEGVTGSPLGVAVAVVPAAQTIPACAGPADAGPDVVIADQCSPFVQESRLALTITASAGPADANGSVTPLAHGRTTITLRLFAQPPYVAVSGTNDAASPDAPHEGDNGGYGNALLAFGPSPAPDDTTIHVLYECSPGTGSCAASDPPPADAPTALPWTNANGVP